MEFVNALPFLKRVQEGSEGPHVDRGRPENSFLLKKLMAPDLGEGNRMPLAAVALSEDRIAAIREWQDDEEQLVAKIFS